MIKDMQYEGILDKMPLISTFLPFLEKCLFCNLLTSLLYPQNDRTPRSLLDVEVSKVVGRILTLHNLGKHGNVIRWTNRYYFTFSKVNLKP